MEDLKIRVNNEAESKEAQELFFELGFFWNIKGKEKDYLNIGWFTHLTTFDKTLGQGYGFADHKEISLPQLRDLVVLKRNDVGDATHCTVTCNAKGFLTSNGIEYFWDYALKEWNKHKHSNFAEYNMKPIGAVIKEYLDPENDYKFIVTDKPFFDWIEIHKGCNIITCQDRMGIPVYFHWKSLGSDEFFLKDEKIWSNNFGETLSDFIEKNEGDVVIVWQRHNQPEELPFIDDEPSLNDQYAEIEQVRQSAWGVQVGGDHYKQFKIQPMQFALENKLDAAQQNVIKYIMRHSFKNGKQDLEKAKHYIDLMIEFYYGDS